MIRFYSCLSCLTFVLIQAQKSSNSSSTRSSRSAAPTQDLEETSEEVTVTEDLNTETVDRVGSETADVPTTSSSVVTSSTDPRLVRECHGEGGW